MTTAIEVMNRMEALRNERERVHLMRFFKTAPGDYGYGDDFLGIRVPETRVIAGEARELPLHRSRAASLPTAQTGQPR